MKYEPCEACGRPADHWGLCRDCLTDERNGLIELRDGLWAETPASDEEEAHGRAA